jgi:hypothetical protein
MGEMKGMVSALIGTVSQGWIGLIDDINRMGERKD